MTDRSLHFSGDVRLAELLDVAALQEMMDDYHALTGMGVGIIDLEGNVLVGTGWQDICVMFHRAVPESCRFCHESDTSLTSGVEPGTFREYRCKNNMWDIATPIMLGERHIGNIFLGQFLYNDEEPDYDLFRSQARRFGYDEQEYLAALDRVPRYSRATVKRAMSFYSKLARMISLANYNNVVLAETLAKSRSYERELLNKNSELERFIYTVSHDLKSPVITIKGFTGSLEQDVSVGRYDRIADDMKRVSAAADRMNSLLQGLLDLSAIGRIADKVQPVSLGTLAGEVLGGMAQLLFDRSIRVGVEAGLPTVMCSRVRIAEVLQNLFENAVKFMGDQPAPTICFGMNRENGRDVFFVRDNGMGIETQYLDTVFGLFNKLNARSEGTGVGLALVKRIIELHGGSVWAESDGPGRGCRFCFTLPSDDDPRTSLGGVT